MTKIKVKAYIGVLKIKYLTERKIDYAAMLAELRAAKRKAHRDDA